jgi:hypothetical protein
MKKISTFFFFNITRDWKEQLGIILRETETETEYRPKGFLLTGHREIDHPQNSNQEGNHSCQTKAKFTVRKRRASRLRYDN